MAKITFADHVATLTGARGFKQILALTGPIPDGLFPAQFETFAGPATCTIKNGKLEVRDHENAIMFRGDYNGLWRERLADMVASWASDDETTLEA